MDSPSLEPTTLEDGKHAAIENSQTQLPTSQHPEPHVEQDLLVEEVSIDGMCGVY